MLALIDFLKKSSDIADILQKIDAGASPLLVSGLSHVHKLLIAAIVRRTTGRPVCFVCADEFDARRMSRDISTLCQEKPYTLVPREFTFHNVSGASRDWEHERISTLHAIATGRAGLILTCPQALAQRTLAPAELTGSGVLIKSGEEYGQTKLCTQLVELGYKRCEQVEAPGQFAVRGGIVDVFSPGGDNPIRIEFWGDDVDAMGEFDAESQRRILNLQAATFLPASETRVDADKMESLAKELTAMRDGLIKAKKDSAELVNTLTGDIELLEHGQSFNALDRYLPLITPEFVCAADYLADNTVVLIDDYHRVKETSKRGEEQHYEDVKTLLEAGILHPHCCEFALPFAELFTCLCTRSTVYLEAFARSTYAVAPAGISSLTAKQLPGYAGNIEIACADIENYMNEQYSVIVLCGTENSARALGDVLSNHGIKAPLDKKLEQVPPNGQAVISLGTLSAGFELPNDRIVFIAEGQLIAPSERRRVRTGKNKSNRARIENYQDLSVGCLVVHDQHGIGRFAGIEKMQVDGVEKDYIKIIYAGTDALYVPVTQLDMVSKYIGGGEDAPIKLSHLGGSDWQRAKSRAKGAAKEMAEQLIKLYAERQNRQGHQFPVDCAWQREFEESFEYDETDDQLRCSNEIKKDMQSTHPMDRLLCGDVGFGKTEVALRAIMKCVLGGKQAAILVPTTVLAQQHYVTATRRFAKFPIRIAVVSRFSTPAQSREAMRKLKCGELDVIIGTHKLLQKTVEFKDLGLLIVDEEQRFGVSHKERLKEMAVNVDVLTLTATPIPRTLNMALSGIRDMSIIEEPPRNRHPVQTYVFEHNWNVIADAIRREISRGGQVYYLHNRVESINAAAGRISRLIPDLTVGIAHGKMNEEELSAVMQQMVEGEIQVLVCSTIIETGIDIPNVNTLIIEDADKLGLSQLHQLRGRVGRSPRHAFAYLTYRRGKVLTEIAEKRLSAIREYAEFGSGFKIAMRDLEIRGAGNILGAEQSGHMMSVGYDMYLKLLEEAVQEEKGEKPKNPTECSADLTVSANIPESYIKSPELRMDMYRRIAALSDEDEAEDMIDELCDRFGEPPKGMLMLIDISMLRHNAAQAGISEITQKSGLLKIGMYDPEFSWISDLCAKPEYKGRILLNAGQEPYLTLKIKKGDDVLETANKFVRDYGAARAKFDSCDK